eukprot:Ihof_evm8s39 gene=Ihof_evmTU8s39
MAPHTIAIEKLKIQSTPVANDNVGCITLVGAGPGDPDLLTMAAHKAIQRATLIVADRLISKEILGIIPESVEVKIARKTPGCAQGAQDELNL